jgi:hypothetical protein
MVASLDSLVSLQLIKSLPAMCNIGLLSVSHGFCPATFALYATADEDAG